MSKRARPHLPLSEQDRYPKEHTNDGQPHLLAFDPTPCFTIESVSTQTNVPTATLRIWERHYGILSTWSNENNVEPYSERDVAAVHWIRKQVISQMSVKQAIIELIRLEPEYAANLGQQARTLQLPSRYDFSLLRDKLMQAVVLMNRASAARILSDAFATYPTTPVLQHLLQPVLAYTFELCRRSILPPTTEMFARTLVLQQVHPYLVEACIAPGKVNEYLTQCVEQISRSTSDRPEMTNADILEREGMLVGVLGRNDESSVQRILDQTFSSYMVEDVCVNLFPAILARLNTLAREKIIAPETEQLGMHLLQKHLASFLHSMPSVDLGPSILIGCIAQERSEIDALIQAILCRRAGLQVQYVGEINGVQPFMRQLETQRPGLIYLGASANTSVRLVAELGREIARTQQHRSLFCFGGAAFEQAPILAQSVTGAYLGSQIEETTKNLRELVRLFPQLSAKQAAELMAPSLLATRSQFYSLPELDADLSILVGCVHPKTSEVEAFILALFWRRTGLQVQYIGGITDTPIFLRQIETVRPALVYLTTESRMSTQRLVEVGREIAHIRQNRPMFCFGGAAFEQAPALAQSVTGVYLGSKPEEILLNLHNLVRLSPQLSTQQVTELMAPNSLRASFQNEIAAANTSMSTNRNSERYTDDYFAGNTAPGIDTREASYSAPGSYPQGSTNSATLPQAARRKFIEWRGTIFYPGSSDIQRALPGLFLVIFPIALLAEAIWFVEINLHATFFVDIFIAGVLALIVANIFTLPEWVQGGLTFSTRWFLRLGILCYGLKFSFLPLLQSGLQNLAIVGASVAIALGVSIIVGRLLKFNTRLSALIGVGTAICGISATMAASPAIHAKDEETAIALGTILCWGTTGLLLYPLIGHLLHLSPVIYGTWTGATIHDLPQLLATAQQGGGAAALKAALFVKLIRMAFIVVVIFCLHIFVGLRERSHNTRGKRENIVLGALKTFPLFVLVFFLIVFVNTVVKVPAWLSGPLATWPAATFPTTASSVFLMLAIIGICARVNRSAIKTAGTKALVLGLTSWVTQSVVVLFASLLLLK